MTEEIYKKLSVAAQASIDEFSKDKLPTQIADFRTTCLTVLY